ncbi:hypothetical protein SAMN04487898_11343 [Pedobacter sp. ok626]|nr:hypothetical protein SAMN04487898_11343 [Pedobacter sp. ok626]
MILEALIHNIGFTSYANAFATPSILSLIPSAVLMESTVDFMV